MKAGIAVLAAVIITAAVSLRGAERTPQAHNQAGWEYLERGENLKASAEFVSALNRNPSYLEARLGLARAHYALEAYRDAYDIWSKILQRDKDNRDALLGTAQALAAMGFYDRSLEAYSRVVEKYSDEIEAHYGIAELYYLMNRTLWASRRIDSIYKLNPRHYRTLLLHAAIKSDAGRIREAEDLIKKAVDASPERAEAYTAYGMLFLKRFTRDGGNGNLEDAVEELNRSLAINPGGVEPLRLMGYIALIRKDYAAAEDYYSRAVASSPKNATLHYSLAHTRERAGNSDGAHAAYRKAHSLNTDDDIIQNGFENMLISSDVEIGSPSRTGTGEYYLALARDSFRNNLAGLGALYLRKSVVMNPMLRDAREELRDYYLAIGYDRFYIEEIKSLQRLFPGNRYRDELNLAVIKRRNTFYFNAGYGVEPPERDVPRVLVLNPFPAGGFVRHPGAGEIIADTITFAGGQFGRMRTGTIADRRALVRDPEVMTFTGIDEYIGYLTDKGYTEGDAKIDFILYGTYYDRPYGMELELNLMNLGTGVVIAQFTLADTGRNYLSRIAYRAAKRLYESVPYRGRILDLRNDGAVINLGTFDGLKKDDLVFAHFENEMTVRGKYKIRKKILMKINEIDTDLCRASVVSQADTEKVRPGVDVYPLMMKRAVRVE